MRALLNKTGLKLAIAVPAILAVAACGTAPLSYLDGRLQPVSRMENNTYSVRVISIDGDYSLQNPRPVGPGLHTLVVSAAPGRGARNVDPQTFTFAVEPCTRYFLGAKRSSKMAAGWDLSVEDKEAVSGCDPAKELAKSKAEQTSQLVPGQS
ncbi:hypothetical protein ACO0LO_07455 [Undibacterium sp. TJN25]|uniref:hypothetical protein n=1 Tax=Undibacterium sp. TJN25 TaxID=3413056 RepID=UPI003BF0A4AC